MVMSAAKTVTEYLAELSPERRAIIKVVRDVIRKRLPKGYNEEMSYGMISYNVPRSVVAETYNGQPLCYAAIAAQKNHTAVYLMGAYAGEEGPVARILLEEFKAAGKKLDMGKSCVRFKSLDDISLDAIGNAVASISVEEYVKIYEKSRLMTKSGAKKSGKTAKAG